MRLLHVVPTYLPSVRYGGPIWAVHGLCRALAARGHQLTVFTTNVDGPEDAPVPLGRPVDVEGVEVRYFPVPGLRRLYWSPAMMAALRREAGSFDLVHLHSIFLWPTWAGARAARGARRPYLLTPHGMLVRELIRRKGYWRKLAWLQLVERGNIERAAGLHVTTALEAQEAAGLGFRLPPVFMVPFGVESCADEVEAPAPALAALLGRKPLLLFLGRLSWKKGLDRLIEALALVPEVHLAIVGNDEEGCAPRLRARAAALGLLGRVSFTGPLYGADKAALLRAATLFVLPSYSENFGVAVLEAIAHGLPALVTPEVGLASELAAARAGKVVAGDPASLAEALRELLGDGDELRAMGLRGQRLVRERFTWEAVAGAMEAAASAVVEAWPRKVTSA